MYQSQAGLVLDLFKMWKVSFQHHNALQLLVEVLFLRGRQSRPVFAQVQV